MKRVSQAHGNNSMGFLLKVVFAMANGSALGAQKTPMRRGMKATEEDAADSLDESSRAASLRRTNRSLMASSFVISKKCIC
ncbi:MAG: hypothetical protein JWM78_940 [Verrucomicrobiaceae bacterium]|nr:hypothetical protein [Verrucomicrobiaceae bacterium]